MDTLINQMPARTANLELGDAKNPLMRLKWNDKSKTAGSEYQYASITIDETGSTASKLIVLINIGASSSDYNQYQFSAYATGITDPSAIDASPTHTQCTTLGAMIAAINLLQDSDIGLWATRLHAPADYSIDTDDFIALAETRLSPNFTEYLYKDASEVLTSAFRLGVPGSINGLVGNGKLKLVQIEGYVDSNSDTDCELKLSYDPSETSASDEKELGFTRKVPDASWTTLWDFTKRPITLNGPVLIEITSTSSMAVGAKIMVVYEQAEV